MEGAWQAPAAAEGEGGMSEVASSVYDHKLREWYQQTPGWRL